MSAVILGQIYMQRWWARWPCRIDGKHGCPRMSAQTTLAMQRQTRLCLFALFAFMCLLTCRASGAASTKREVALRQGGRRVEGRGPEGGEGFQGDDHCHEGHRQTTSMS